MNPTFTLLVIESIWLVNNKLRGATHECATALQKMDVNINARVATEIIVRLLNKKMWIGFARPDGTLFLKYRK